MDETLSPCVSPQQVGRDESTLDLVRRAIARRKSGLFTPGGSALPWPEVFAVRLIPLTTRRELEAMCRSIEGYEFADWCVQRLSMRWQSVAR
jgi:hypothetical protein